MQGRNEKNISDVLDAAQLIRIESVNRGFLYQHLYAVGCLLLAQAARVDAVMVELDEDSVANVSQVVTIDRYFLADCAGSLPAATMKLIGAGLRLVLFF